MSQIYITMWEFLQEGYHVVTERTIGRYCNFVKGCFTIKGFVVLPDITVRLFGRLSAISVLKTVLRGILPRYTVARLLKRVSQMSSDSEYSEMRRICEMLLEEMHTFRQAIWGTHIVSIQFILRQSFVK
jgi:hypothetical protein